MTVATESAKVTFISELEIVNCDNCGGTYALSEKYLERKSNMGGVWHCPYCQVSYGYIKSENEELKEKLTQKTEQLKYERTQKQEAYAQSEKSRHQKSGMKGASTRNQNKLKRINQGVCPHCNRYFKNLHQHILSKHNKKDSDSTKIKRK